MDIEREREKERVSEQKGICSIEWHIMETQSPCCNVNFSMSLLIGVHLGEKLRLMQFLLYHIIFAKIIDTK